MYLNRIVTAILCLLLFTPVFAESITVSLEEAIKNGDQLWSEKKFEEAEKAYRKASEIDEESSDPYRRLAALYMSQNRTSDAIDAYQDAIVRDTEDATLFIGIALAYLHEQSFTKASLMTQRALQLDPELAQAKKLEEYIVAKQEQIAEQETDQATTAPHPMPGNDKPAPAPR